MTTSQKATRIHLLDFRSIPMRTFHMTWFAFFLCFFGWFGIAPLMPIVRQELALTKEQVGNIIVASVAVTIVARLAIGWLCDRVGPRRAYSWVLIAGALPVLGIGFATTYETFLLFRLAIGLIGASFVITQYHTSVMFAPEVVGTANATTAGWGNLGGGVTQLVMPLIFAGMVHLGLTQAAGWRAAMVVPGVALLLTGLVYRRVTRDYPEGNYEDLAAKGELPAARSAGRGFLEACRDYRVWALFLVYGACFGIELTINNMAALYFTDQFQLSLETAGLVASLFGLMNLFARTLGGVFGDRAGARFGLQGRVWLLGAVILLEGVALALFSRCTVLPLAIAMLIVFSLFVQMSEGATFSVVPFINRKALGAVSGIVGAGGNFGAVAAGFLLRADSIPWPQALLILGAIVSACSLCTLAIRFPAEAPVPARAGVLVPGAATAGD